MEQTECCILGICCDDVKRVDALAQKLADETSLNEHQAEVAAQFMRDHYDLAPKGTIQPLIDLVAAEAREYPYQG